MLQNSSNKNCRSGLEILETSKITPHLKPERAPRLAEMACPVTAICFQALFEACWRALSLASGTRLALFSSLCILFLYLTTIQVPQLWVSVFWPSNFKFYINFVFDKLYPSPSSFGNCAIGVLKLTILYRFDPFCFILQFEIFKICKQILSNCNKLKLSTS